MSIHRYRVEERAEVMRVYEVDAASENGAIDIVQSGAVEPIELFDVESSVSFLKICGITSGSIPHSLTQ